MSLVTSRSMLSASEMASFNVVGVFLVAESTSKSCWTGWLLCWSSFGLEEDVAGEGVG